MVFLWPHFIKVEIADNQNTVQTIVNYYLQSHKNCCIIK